MRKSSKVAPGESRSHGEDELRSQKRIEELEREKAELLATVDTQREEIARLREENKRLRAASTLSSRVTGAGDGDKASSTPKPPTFTSAPSAAAAEAASKVVVAEKATAENAASEKAATEKAAAEKAAAEKAAAEKASEKSASGGCGNSKQVGPAEPEPGPVAFPESDQAEEQRIIALLDSPNPDVLELRRLTPAQAAAAAEAAARQEARIEKLKAVPDAERKPMGDDFWTVSGGGAIAQLMEKTPLIDLEWVIDLIELGGTVPRCQDVPNAAVLTASTVWRLAIAANFQQLPVLVLSYPWLDFWHPDRLGAQLRGLLQLFKAYLEYVRKRNGPHCTVGLMMDFLCLPQKPFTTDAERARFGESLHSINEWYFHPCTRVLVVSTPPPEGAKYTNTRLHEARGWCYFEMCAAMAVKHEACLWDVAGLAGRTYGEGSFVLMENAMKAKREPPLSPDTMAEDLRSAVASGTRAFTANADVEVVMEQYARGFVKAFSNHTTQYPRIGTLFYTGFNWDDEQGRTMLEAIKYAVQHGEFPGDTLYINFMNSNKFSEEMKATFTQMNATAGFGKKIVLQ